ncbi:mechanosensitive ion channel family protein [Halopseudomonas sp.]|uniref:mechanosensitive ion channel family protein n=1 Tax=Halopseudomonas sp. TaxID=2901191 RepID=UPI0035663A63
MELNWSQLLALTELRVLLLASCAVIVLVVAARILCKLAIRITSRLPFVSQVVLNLCPPFTFFLPLLGLQGVWAAAPEDTLFINGIQHFNGLAIIGVVTWMGISAVQAFQQAIERHNPTDVRNNLRARRIHTQTQLLVRTLSFFVLLFGLSIMLMTFPAVRQIGAGLMASAGVAGLAVGFAAKPVLGNIIAGLQIAVTQPIRLDDVVIVENEWGRIEEITGTYVVIRIWDERRLIVPLQYFIEQPFQNWTRETASIIGSVYFWVDYSMPLEPLRAELDRLLEKAPELWDGRVKVLQVTDTTDKVIQLRALASAFDAPSAWDLRCYLRENLVGFMQREYPGNLPHLRIADVTRSD